MSLSLPIKDSASIFLVAEGSGSYQDYSGQQRNLSPGTVVFVPAGQSITIQVGSDCTKVVIYQAFCDL